MDRTRSLQDVLDGISRGVYEPVRIFRTTPVLEVRRACLKKIHRDPWPDEKRADEIERDIEALGFHDLLTEEYLSAYMFSSQGITQTTRVLGFAIRTCPAFVPVNDLTKVICGLVRQRLWAYQPMVHEYLATELGEIGEGLRTKRVCDSFDWQRIKRITELATLARDRNMLDLLSMLSVRLRGCAHTSEQGAIKEIVEAQRLAIIEAAMGILLKCYKS